MINVYIADLTGLEKEYDKKLNMLHKSRADKLTSYKMSADRIRGLGAGLLLEKGLVDYLEAPLPKDADGRYIIEYGYGSNGKPYLVDFPEVHFSLSHSGNVVALAIADSEVGIDVQEHRGYSDKIAERFYHEEEKKMLEAVSDPVEKEILFYKIWTCKEGYIKYTGKGMGQELRDFYCNIDTGDIYKDNKTIAKCVNINMEKAEYQCCIVSGNNAKKIDKILKIMI